MTIKVSVVPMQQRLFSTYVLGGAASVSLLKQRRYCLMWKFDEI